MSTPGTHEGSTPLQGEILNHTTDAIMALDRDGRIVLWNRAAERVFQRPASEVLGKSPREAEVYPWLTRDDEHEATSAVTDTGIWRGEAMQQAGNGKASYLESTVTGLVDTAGNIIGMLAVVRDITTAKRNELEQDQSIEHLQRMFERLKTVAGVIPICSHCKRIRDEHASWHEIETYIGARLGMKFSHGICPSCFQTLHRDCLTRPSTL
jgi:PAS domain S-box-containing protein